MLKIFESKKKKSVQEFILHLDFMQMFILESLKKEFPEEVLWFLSEVSNKKIKYVIPSVAVVSYSLLGALNEKQEKLIRKELYKKNLLNENDMKEFISFWISSEKDYFPDGIKPSTVDMVNFVALVFGEYLCSKVEINYEEANQAYKFSEEFVSRLGNLLFDKFNIMLELIEDI